MLKDRGVVGGCGGASAPHPGAPQRATFQRLSDWGNGRGGKEEGWEHRLGVGVGVLYGGALG